jgi:hypothetical protein
MLFHFDDCVKIPYATSNNLYSPVAASAIKPVQATANSKSPPRFAAAYGM